MTKKGIRVRTGTRIERIAPGFTIHLSDGSTIEADCILAATGRWPNSDHLGLEPIGVVTGRRGEVVVDENYTTNIASIHAIGDVTDRIQLTPVALAEGMAFAQRFFGDGKRSVSYEFVPTAVFTHPTYACVGLTEQQAKARGYLVRIFKSTFTPLKHRLTHRAEQVFMKLVVDANTDRVLGAHMLGSDASEIIPGFAAALTCGATKAQLDATIGIHPTVAEEFLTMREASPV
jgi:glutathione reductase (NADPH)